MDIIDGQGIIQRFESDADGIHYRVIVEGETCWHRYVRFGKDVRHRAGGVAFIEAAREQEKQAQTYRKDRHD